MQENTVFPFILSFSLNVVQKTYEKLQVSNVFGNHNGYSTRRANPTFGISKTGIHSSLFSRIKQYYKSKPKWRMALSNLSRFQPTLRVWSCWLLPIQRAIEYQDVVVGDVWILGRPKQYGRRTRKCLS